MQSTSQAEGNLKHNDGRNRQLLFLLIMICSVFFLMKKEWTENEIHAFAEALEKFHDDWTQIAEYVHRSEQSCRAFYQKYRKKNGLVDDEHVTVSSNRKRRIDFLFCFQ
jgi:hypothetical protein